MVLTQLNIEEKINKKVKQYMLDHDIDIKTDALIELIVKGLNSKRVI